MGRGGGQMVIVLTFYSDNACSNPAERTVLVLQNCLKRAEIKKKEDGDGPFLEKTYIACEIKFSSINMSHLFGFVPF